ncbi:MAG: DUF4249 domain-containing protein [Bacteroidales bacterium]|nr:DUF4249 domain-containing protein [Bacteroidales bacterium]
MKRLPFIILLVSFAVLSCEEVIDVNLNDSSPVLTVEGLILLNSACSVRLAYTSSYFDEGPPVPEEDAIISVSDSEERGEVLEHLGKGIYRGNIIAGLPGHTYTLVISSGDKEYRASSKLHSRPELLKLEYEELDIPHYYEETIYSVRNVMVDDPFSENYYLLMHYRNGSLLNDHYSTYSDRFLNTDTLVYTDFRLNFYRGDTVKVELYAIDQGVYNYFNLVNDMLVSAFSSSTPFNPESNFGSGIMGYFMAASFDSKTIIID